MASRRTPILAAVIGNLLLALAKFVAAAVSGSVALASEGIHSLVDTANDGLLLLAIRLSRRPADRLHPFGYGKEVYFWSLIVATVIFVGGAGISIYEGIQRLTGPHKVENPTLGYIVIGIGVAFEGATWIIASRAFRRYRGDEGVWAAIRTGKDPTRFAVLLEDSAALLGLAIAALGLFLSDRFDIAAFDAVASLLIGLLLLVIAAILGYESRHLIIGEQVSPQMLARIQEMASDEDAVDSVIRTLTMHVGPDDVLVTLELRFRRGISAQQIQTAIARIERRLRAEFPVIRYIFVEVEALTGS